MRYPTQCAKRLVLLILIFKTQLSLFGSIPGCCMNYSTRSLKNQQSAQAYFSEINGKNLYLIMEMF